MKKIFLALLLVAVTITGRTQSAAQAKVAAAVDQLHKAMIAADKTSLVNIAADSLSYGHSNGLVENRTEFADRIVTGKSGWVKIETSEQTIVVSGKTAIVRHILKGKTSDSGKPGEVHLRIMQVWQKTKSGWKILARQAVKMS